MTAKAEIEEKRGQARWQGLAASPAAAGSGLSRARSMVSAVSLSSPLGEWRARLPFLSLPAIVLGGWMIVIRRYDGLYGQDPYAYLSYAVGPLRQALLHGTPLTSSFLPLGYPLLAALASFATGANAAAGQVVSGLAAVLALGLTYLLARDGLCVAGVDSKDARTTGILASLMLSASGYFVRFAVTDMSDMTALACTLLSAWTLVRWLEARRSDWNLSWLVVSSGSMAYAIVSWWGDGVLAIVWVTVALPALLHISWRTRIQSAIAGVLPATLIVGVQLFFAFTVPADGVRPAAFLGNLSLQGDSWSVLNLFRHSFHNSDGLLQYSIPNVLFYVSEPFRTDFFTPLFVLPVVLAGIELTRRAWFQSKTGSSERYRASRGKGENAAIFLIAGWPLALLLFDSGLPWQDPRWVLASAPPIAILAGLGCVRLRAHLHGLYRAFSMVAIGLGILAISVGSVRGLAVVASAQAGEVSTINWVRAEVPATSTLLTFEITPGIQFRTHLHAVELYGLSPAGVDRYVSARSPVYLFLNVNHMATQWATMDPARDYRHLLDTGRLRLIGSRGGYTLFVVRTTSQQGR